MKKCGRQIGDDDHLCLSAQAVDNFFSGGGAAYSSEPQADASKIAELFERYRGACRLSTLGPISCFDVVSSSAACRADPVAFPVRAFGVEQVICTPPRRTRRKRQRQHRDRGHREVLR